jgi:antitoxin (DNA-binding transcriptional repressor) of toxin-antitoxin stability system
MSVTIPIETAARELRDLLERLKLGETITLVSKEGKPEALLVSLKPALTQPLSTSDLLAEWDALAEKVSQAWKSDKSALQTLAEMRR